jgi:leucyl aminopeptidase
MKQIIEVKLGTRRVEFVSCKTDTLVIGRFSDARALDRLGAELDKKLDGAIGRVLKLGDFEGKSGSSVVVYGEGKIGARRVMLVGLGEKAKATLDTVRRAAMHAANRAAAMKVKNVALALHRALNGRLDAAAMGRAMAEGAYFGSFRYDEYVTGDENGRPDLLKVDIVEPDAKEIERLKDGVRCGAVIGRAQSYARTLANRPANVINPPMLANEAQEAVRGVKGLSCTVLDERQLAAKCMGGILAVGSGSQSKPRFIILKYSPSDRAGKNRPKVALVGKAITFDSGGISIKPATDMDQMKLDKTGGIAVLSTLRAAAELGLGLDVLGLIPSAENLPSGSSYRPGDIVTTYSGKTVEILNTDAEGRMILCDALAYAVEQKCDIIVDIATLTGACMVALGTYMAGLMGNDDKLVEEIKRAAEESGEKVWPMPSGDEYAEEMKSKIADLRNTGGKWGGACTAAAFLKQFVGQAKWAHLDIAGVDIFDKPTEYAGPGSTGFGVRLLTTYLMNLAETKDSMG